MIATGIEENVPVAGAGQGLSDWTGVYTLFRGILARIPRTAPRQVIEPIADELSLLADELIMVLENHVKTRILNANESQAERHIQNSNPDSQIDLEPASRKGRGARLQPPSQTPGIPEGMFPLGMVLDACPDIAEYAKSDIANWRDFEATAAVVRAMLGVSPSAWEEAQAVMGGRQAAIVVAAILQRGSAVNNAGAYLRGLTRKAEAHEFSVGPMLMALIGSRKREKKRA
jgi:replication initiation protein RepC